MPKRYPFLFRGNFAKTSRQSFEVDHPPKKKKPWRHSTFLGMEMSHFSNATPWGGRRATSPGDGCAGRVLRPAQAVTWECGGDFPKEFQAEVSGAVGNVTFSMDPFWSDINENGDKAIIDLSSGLITIDAEEEVCQGQYPPWIIYFVCDDCGCSSGTIWLEDCSADCDACIGADCGLPVLSGADTIGPDTTGQYALDDDQGDVSWAISGSGFSIDQTGLVTTSSACGSADITATDSCCGEFTKRIRSTVGVWNTISSESGGINGVGCVATGDTCANAHGASGPLQDCIVDGLRYKGNWRCMFENCAVDCDTFGPAVPACWPNPCGANIQYVHTLEILEWICI